MRYLNLARFKPLFTRSPLVLQQVNSIAFSTVPETDKSKIIKCPFPDVQIPKKSLYFFVAENFAKHGAKTALIDGTTGKETSYNELEEMIAKVGSALLRMGVRRNDVVSLISPNSAEFAVQFFASSAVGAIVHPVNPVYTSGEIAYQLKDCRAKYIATVSSILSTVKEAASQVGVPNDKIIVLDTDGDGEHISFNKLLEDSGSSFPDGGVLVDSDEMACLLYSSGTTGLPKGVMLSHFNIVANVCQLDHPQLLDVRTPASCLLGVLPFYHIYAMTVILTLGLRQGSSILSLPKFEPQLFLSSLERFAVTNAFVAPPLAVFMAKSPLVSQYNLSSLREIFSAAAPLGLDLAKAVKDRIGVKVVRQGYGLTECSPLSHCCPIDIDKPNSLGGPVLNTEICIVDTQSGQVLGPNECGELLIRGPQVMLGYLNRPEATASSVTNDGWFYSGDICKSVHTVCTMHFHLIFTVCTMHFHLIFMQCFTNMRYDFDSTLHRNMR